VDDLKGLLAKIVPLLLVAVLVLGMGFLIRSEVLALAEARNAAIDEQKAIAHAEARLQTLLQYQADESILLDRMAKVERLMPSEAGEGLLVKEIQAVANSANTRFLTVRFDKHTQGDQYKEIPLQITFEGRYEGLLELLDGLRDRSRAIRVDELKIGEGSEELPQIKADIKAKAFSRQ